MFLAIITATLCGCLAGVITGLIPGIHVNLISVAILTFSNLLFKITSPFILSVFIVAMAVTHTFLDSIPSIFLGAPDPDMALGVLPGHRLLFQGKAYEAVKLTVIGSLLSLITVIATIPLALLIVPSIYLWLQKYMGYFLISISLYIILKEKSLNRIFWGSLVFILSGLLGIIVLTWKNIKQPLFPLLSGLFGISTLIISLSKNVEIPKQYVSETIEVGNKNKIKAIIAAVFSGSLTGLTPGLGAAQAAIIATQIVGKINIHSFMILLGGVNTANFTFSLFTFYALKKARNGAVIAIQELIRNINLRQLALLLFVVLISGCIATFLALFFSKLFTEVIGRINYKMLCLIIISFITMMTITISGFIGLIILITSSLLGIMPALLNIRRSHAMGCLLLPLILFFIL